MLYVYDLFSASKKKKKTKEKNAYWLNKVVNMNQLNILRNHLSPKTFNSIHVNTKNNFFLLLFLPPYKLIETQNFLLVGIKLKMNLK